MLRFLLITCILLNCAFVKGQGIISTFAGGGAVGDGSTATAANINAPNSGVFDKHGNYYFCEISVNKVRRISNAGIVTTVAGNGTSGFSGDNGPATQAKLWTPTGVALDTLGNLYIADGSNNRIRKVDMGTGIITTIAGDGTGAFYGDGGPATAAQISNPQDICFDRSGNLYIAEGFNYIVRKINTLGVISTFAGNGGWDTTGDGGLATAAKFKWPCAVCFDSYGNLLIADYTAFTIRKVSPGGIITRVAGNGGGIYAGIDNLPATSISINPIKIGVDKYDNIFFADNYNKRLFRIDRNSIAHVEAGNGLTAMSGDGIAATSSTLYFPGGIAFDSCDNIYVPEVNYGRIRKITYPHCNYLDAGITTKQLVEVMIYPIPVTTELTIANVKEEGSYRLLNIVGTVIQQGVIKTGNNSIDVEWLPCGFYMLELSSENGQKNVSRVVKE